MSVARTSRKSFCEKAVKVGQISRRSVLEEHEAVIVYQQKNTEVPQLGSAAASEEGTSDGVHAVNHPCELRIQNDHRVVGSSEVPPSQIEREWESERREFASGSSVGS